MKKCPVCKETRKKEEFPYETMCRSCLYKKVNDYRRNTPPLKYQFNKNKPWTKEDIEYLKNYKDIDSLEDLGYALGRSIGAIAQKKSEMLASKRPARKKKKKQYKICSICKKEYEASEKYFHPKTSTPDGLCYVCKKCHYKTMKEFRKNTPPKEQRFNHKKHWTEKEVNYLIENNDVKRKVDLAYDLGRSVGAIYEKCRILRKEGIID